jgi:hypothetical protein
MLTFQLIKSLKRRGQHVVAALPEDLRIPTGHKEHRYPARWLELQGGGKQEL